MKYRAVFYIEGRDLSEGVSERCIYFQAEHTTEAEDVIRSSVSEIYKCKASDVEFYNLVSEFHDNEAINLKKVGWDADGKPIIDKNPLVIE